MFQPRLRCPGHPTHWAPHQGTTPSRGPPPPRHWVQWKTWGPKPHPLWSTSQDTGDHPSPQGLRFRGGGALTAGPTQSCPAPIPKAPCQEPASWAAWPHTSSLRPPPLNGLPVLHVRPNKTADPGGCRPVQQDSLSGRQPRQHTAAWWQGADTTFSSTVQLWTQARPPDLSFPLAGPPPGWATPRPASPAVPRPPTATQGALSPSKGAGAEVEGGPSPPAGPRNPGDFSSLSKDLPGQARPQLCPRPGQQLPSTPPPDPQPPPGSRDAVSTCLPAFPT